MRWVWALIGSSYLFALCAAFAVMGFCLAMFTRIGEDPCKPCDCAPCITPDREDVRCENFIHVTGYANEQSRVKTGTWGEFGNATYDFDCQLVGDGTARFFGVTYVPQDSYRLAMASNEACMQRLEKCCTGGGR